MGIRSYTWLLLSLSALSLVSLTSCKEELKKEIATPHHWYDSIHSFSIALQNQHYEQINDVSSDLIIIDADDSNLTHEQIQRIKGSGKKIYSYLSIGEAENYRSYWKKSWKRKHPPFLDKENPEWKGNFKVRYWDKEWQDIIFKRLQELVDLGYDGVYLDIIDAFEYYEQKGRKEAAQEMVDFVSLISKHAKQANPDFKIIPQNGLGLLDNPKYLSHIDGVGKEETWYSFDNRPVPNDTNAWDVGLLNKAYAAGKMVLLIDYPTDHQKQCEFIAKAKEKGFIPYVGNRSLNKFIDVKCK
ncbi:MAG: endo alpha-1,4 polygalactosaminidase [Alphaproteobacteria bacterium]|nr:endo alpha-1,4 polygalactosaminidase [Alphaproteobacteria bacterium]